MWYIIEDDIAQIQQNTIALLRYLSRWDSSLANWFISHDLYSQTYSSSMSPLLDICNSRAQCLPSNYQWLDGVLGIAHNCIARIITPEIPTMSSKLNEQIHLWFLCYYYCSTITGTIIITVTVTVNITIAVTTNYFYFTITSTIITIISTDTITYPFQSK